MKVFRKSIIRTNGSQDTKLCAFLENYCGKIILRYFFF